MKKIKKAIIPVAGFGTRFLPATKSQPKEMLAVLDKPVIQYLVEDAVSAGIEEIIFVTSRGKCSIEDHFDKSFELEHNLKTKNKKDLLGKIEGLSSLAKFSYVRQVDALGDGHAINCASHLVSDEPVLIIFGDTLYDAPVSASKQIIDLYEHYQDPVIGLSEVAKEKLNMFGVIDGLDLGEGNYEIKKMVEKPDIDKAPSNLAAVGLYVITPEVFQVLSEMKSEGSSEIRLADAFALMLERNRALYGKNIEGEWLDTGNKLNLLKASLKLGIKDEEIKDELKEFLKDLSDKI